MARFDCWSGSRAGAVRAVQMPLLPLLLLTPAVLLVAHGAFGSGLFLALGLTSPPPHATRVALGMFVNERDNMSYAAWAQQTLHGHLLLSDLYTTSPHSAVLVNPYFSVIGLICRMTGRAPYPLMVAIGILAAAVFGWLVHAIGRALGMSGRLANGAVFIAVACSGPSWVLYLLHAVMGDTGAAGRPFLGVDGYYFDIFPVTIFLCYPFQSFNLALLAGVTLLMVRALQDSPPEWTRVLPAAVAGALAVLVRPYDAVLLCGLFPVCLAWSGGRRRLLAAASAAVVALPACLYVAKISQLPVWRDFARGSVMTGPTRLEMAAGFSVMLLIASAAMRNALRSGDRGVGFLVAWAGGITMLVLVAGGSAARFASGATIPCSLLAAWGVAALAGGGAAACGGGGAAQHAADLSR